MAVTNSPHSISQKDGRPSPTIIPSLMGTNERYDLPVTCPHEIQVTCLAANTLGGQRAVSICVQ